MIQSTSPLVSIVIPTYNHARYLGRALQSVLSQTYPNWEVIVIDNHSTDDTDAVMSIFSDSRITLLKIHNNGIIAASRNAGIRFAKGEWIAFLDSDDWWKSDKLQRCVECINDQVALIHHNLEIVRDPPNFYKRKQTKGRQLLKPVIKDLLLKGNIIANTSVVVRKSLLEQIGGINENFEMTTAEDYNTWLRIAQISDNFLYIPRSLGFYLFHTGGNSRKSNFAPIQAACREFIHFLEPQEKMVYEATARYIKVLNNFYSCKPDSEKRDLLHCIRNGNLSIRVKSFFLYIVLILQF